MFAPASIAPRFRDAFVRTEQRLVREVMVKSAWVVLLVSAITNGSVLIRGGSVIDMDPTLGALLRVPPLIVCAITLLLHYWRLPGLHWPLIMLRLISLSAMWSVFGLLVFAYEQGGTAFRIMSELSISAFSVQPWSACAVSGGVSSRYLCPLPAWLPRCSTGATPLRPYC